MCSVREALYSKSVINKSSPEIRDSFYGPSRWEKLIGQLSDLWETWTQHPSPLQDAGGDLLCCRCRTWMPSGSGKRLLLSMASFSFSVCFLLRLPPFPKLYNQWRVEGLRKWTKFYHYVGVIQATSFTLGFQKIYLSLHCWKLPDDTPASVSSKFSFHSSQRFGVGWGWGVE